MPRIDLPEGDGEQTARLWSLRPELGEAVRAFGDAVQAQGRLPLREREAARMRIAHINGCLPCSEARIAGMAELGIDEAFYADVSDPARRTRYSAREALAIGFAERFAAGRETFDEPFWAQLRAAFRPDELVELATSVAKWLAIGRINAVFELELSCPITIPRPAS